MTAVGSAAAAGRGPPAGAVLWLALPLLLACGVAPNERKRYQKHSGEVHRWQIDQRLITEEPVETFDWARLYEHVTVLSRSFGSADDLAAWKIRPEGTATAVPGGLLVNGGGRPVTSLVHAVDLEAETLDAIEVDVAGLRQGPLRFFWRREGEQFKAERGLRVRGDPEAGGGTVTYTLAVAGHSGWAGRIRRLRLDPTMAPGEEVRIEAVRGIRYHAPPGRVRAAAGKPWKVDLDHELRGALLAPPGTPVERRVEVAGGARLRFAYGVSGRLGVPMIFTVRVEEDGAEPRRMFEARLDPAVDRTAVWREGSADLAGFAGKPVRLVLETSPVGEWDPSSGMPAFANPEILRPAPAEGRPSVVLISIDTLRADHLSTYGYARRTSPNLDAWAARAGVVFEHTVVSAPWTLPSHVSLLSGIDADRHGVNHGLPMPADIPMLPEYLRRAGYRTLAITGGGWMRPDYGFARGFDLYRYWPAGIDREDELEQGVARAQEWLARWSNDPLFLFFHTFEVHSPHRRRQPFFAELAGSTDSDEGSIVTEKSSAPPEEGYLLSKSFMWHRKGATPRLSPVAAGEIPEVVDRYDSAVAFTDDRIGRLLRHLEELGLSSNTVVVVTSDHGDGFGEKGLASHGYLYDFNLLVPLIIALPGGAGGGLRVAEQVRSVDVVPTILDLLDLPVPAPSEIDGTSLRELLEGRSSGAAREAWSYAASSNRGISVRLANRQKYILNHTPWPPLQGREELYDLTADPAEERDLSATGPRLDEIRRRAVRRLTERVQGLVVRVRNSESEPLHGTLRGAAIREFRLKTLAPEGSSLSWSENEPGIAGLTIPPGGFGVFIIESAGSEALEVEVEVGRGGAARAIFDGAVDGRLDRPWQLRYDGSRWRMQQTADQDAPTAVTIVRRGSARPAALDPAAADDQLRDQLRALGYLE